MTRRFSRLAGAVMLVLLADAAVAQQVSPPSAKDTVQFLAIGDTGTGDRAQYEVATQLAKVRAVFPFTFAIMMGDNMYGNERTSDYAKKFELPYKPLLDARRRVLRVARQPRRPQPALLQAVQHERRALLHVQEGQRPVLRARQQLLRSHAGSTGSRRRWPSRLEDWKMAASSIIRCTRPAAGMDRKRICGRSSSRCS